MRVLDRPIDETTVARDLRAAVAASGMSAARFATYLGTSGSRISTYLSGTTTPSAVTYLRAIRLGDAFAELHERRWPTPDETARATCRAVGRHEDGNDPIDWPLRSVLLGRDCLRNVLREDGIAILAWTETAPRSTGYPQWDALVAAVTAYEFESAGEAGPSWTLKRHLATPWSPLHPWLDATEVRDRTPDWLSRYGIYLPERDLTTA